LLGAPMAARVRQTTMGSNTDPFRSRKDGISMLKVPFRKT
jgi:hypothetical protein